MFRYFSTTDAKFAILTNGLSYHFYTDLEEQNKMYMKPFLEFDILDIKESYVGELKKFHKDNFDIEVIFNTASELKYSIEIKLLIEKQLKNPTDEFVKYILSEIYAGVRTQNIVERFRDIVKQSLNQFINEMMNYKITSALKNQEDENKESTESEGIVEEVNTNKENEITTEELEAFYIIRQILSNIIF